MKKLALFVLAIAAGLISSQVALAQNYDFAFAGSNMYGTYSGSGILDVSGGMIQSLTGTFDGSTMILLGPETFASNDNAFTAAAPYVDENGVSFAAGGVDYNIYYYATTAGYAVVGCTQYSDCITSNPYGDPSTPLTTGSFTLVPEGGSSLLYLLLAGGACFGFMLFGSRYRIGNQITG